MSESSYVCWRPVLRAEQLWWLEFECAFAAARRTDCLMTSSGFSQSSSVFHEMLQILFPTSRSSNSPYDAAIPPSDLHDGGQHRFMVENGPSGLILHQQEKEQTE